MLFHGWFFISKKAIRCYNCAMKILSSFFGYLKWHYGKALITTFSLWKNILFFLLNFFSIKSLLANFFTPWKRLADTYPKKFDLKIYFFTFIANTIMRIVGMILRAIIIIIGLSCCAIYIITLPLTLLIWLALPPIVIGLIVYGLILIFFSHNFSNKIS